VGFSVPAEQVTIMFCLIGLGWLAVRVHWFGAEALKGMTNLLLFLVSPAVIVQAFQRPFDLGRLQTIGIVFVVDLAAFALTIGIANALFNRRLVADENHRTALRFGTVYSNAGFIGIPLTQAVLGDDGVLYAVAFLAAFTIFLWTHGLAMFGDHESPMHLLKGAVLNPGIVSILVALPLFLFSITLPSPISDVLGYLASMNTPLSMLVVGASLAAFSLRTVFSDGFAWLGTVVRNVAIPVIFIGLLMLLPIEPVARTSIVISVSTPVGASVVIFSLRHERDTVFATRLLCLSTLVSLLTLPAALVVAGLAW